MSLLPQTALAFAILCLLRPVAPVRAEGTAPTAQKPAAAVQPLQGTWEGEGIYAGQEPELATKVTMRFTEHSLHYQGSKTNDWYDATFTLPPETSPAQLHAVITASPDKGSLRVKLFAIFKLEEGVLTLAEVADGALETLEKKGDDKALFNVVEGSFNLGGTNASDRWKDYDDHWRFRVKLRKVLVQPKKAAASAGQ